MRHHLIKVLGCVLLAGFITACDTPDAWLDGPRTSNNYDRYDPFWNWFDYQYVSYASPHRHRAYWERAYGDYWRHLDKPRRQHERRRYRKWLHNHRPHLRHRLNDDAFVDAEMRHHIATGAQRSWERKSLRQKKKYLRRIAEIRRQHHPANVRPPGRNPGRHPNALPKTRWYGGHRLGQNNAKRRRAQHVVPAPNIRTIITSPTAKRWPLPPRQQPLQQQRIDADALRAERKRIDQIREDVRRAHRHIKKRISFSPVQQKRRHFDRTRPHRVPKPDRTRRHQSFDPWFQAGRPPNRMILRQRYMP